MEVSDAGERLNRLEQGQVRLEGKTDANTRQLAELMPLGSGLIRLEGVVNGVRQDVVSIKEDMKQHSEGERSLRLALVGLCGTILMTLIGAIVTIVLGGGHP